MQLTSTHNPLLATVRRAAESGRPTPDGLIVAEGPHVLREVLGSGWRLERVFVAAAETARHAELLSKATAEVVEVSERAFRSIAATEAPQGILGLVRPPAWNWGNLLLGQPLLVVLDGIQDPGNAGTIVRSAEAFGASGIVFVQGSARVSSGKMIRAAAGSLFRLPFLENVGREEVLDRLQQEDVRSYVLVAGASETISEANLAARCALVVGNEGAGAASAFLHRSRPVCVPTRGVESLNAAVACSIALFEAARQRAGQGR